MHIHKIYPFSNPPALTLGEEEERLRPACKKAYRYTAQFLSFLGIFDASHIPQQQKQGNLLSRLGMLMLIPLFLRLETKKLCNP